MDYILDLFVQNKYVIEASPKTSALNSSTRRSIRLRVCVH